MARRQGSKLFCYILQQVHNTSFNLIQIIYNIFSFPCTKINSSRNRYLFDHLEDLPACAEDDLILPLLDVAGERETEREEVGIISQYFLNSSIFCVYRVVNRVVCFAQCPPTDVKSLLTSGFNVHFEGCCTSSGLVHASTYGFDIS